MPVQKYTFFIDLGGVIIGDDFRIGAVEVARKHKIPLEQLRSAMGGKCWHALMTGRMSTAEFARAVDRELGIRGIAREVFAVRTVRTPVYRQVIKALRSLKRDGHRLILFSDSTPLWIGHWRRRLRLRETFDAQVVSSNMHLRKPDPRIYALAMRRFRPIPDRTVWVDDKARNLVEPARMGMQTVYARTPKQIVRALNRYIRQ